jgi:acyl-CoA thioester hydrolase
MLDVGCRVGRIGRSSAQLIMGIWRGEDHLTSGELVYVNIDLRTRTAKPWPMEFRSKVIAYEKTSPA